MVVVEAVAEEEEGVAAEVEEGVVAAAAEEEMGKATLPLLKTARKAGLTETSSLP
jgi:hypothetical protein